MSDKFNGFSQEDINKITSKTFKTMSSAAVKGHGIRRVPDKREIARSQENLKTRKPEKSAKKAPVTPPPTHDHSIDDINLNKTMSKSIEEALFYQPIPKAAESNQDVLDESSILKVVVTNNNSSDESSILPEPVDNIESPFKGISLKDFEVHRKIIQEQNKQKKEMLQKAIEAHSQKTAAEAKKIEEIKAELSKLDNDLATDVAVLRKQIDSACIHYATIEKQYNKIEAQFLKAKMDLHNASEKKELLTEHLCTVIAHNEDRKAQKLSELMNKVGLTPSGDSVDTNGFHNDASI